MAHRMTATPAAEAPVFYLEDEHRASGRQQHHARLLDLPDERLPHLRDPVRDLRRARRAATPAGPGPRDLFDLPLVALNTAHAAVLLDHLWLRHAGDGARAASAATQAWLAVTGLFGLAFLGIELYEFAHLIHEGATPQRSAFLSSFFTLVGTHGLHVTFGIVWLVTLMVQVARHGLIAANQRRLMCLSMFWHFLDVVWIGVFTFVYLMGMLR